MPKRNRSIGSVKDELLHKSREAMLSAIQVFNNPTIQFKSETFIVLAIIAWTYLLHAYYRGQKIEYRYFDQGPKKKRFHRTKHGAFKYWELERCIDTKISPIDPITAINLRFLIGLRHEIEHQMTTKIDNFLSAKFQACCLNYNAYSKKLFPSLDGIEKYLSFSLQFSSLSETQVEQLSDHKELPPHIAAFIQTFEQSMQDIDFNDSRFSYRVLFVPKTANKKGQADRVIEFISADSEIAKGMNKEYVVFKDKEKQKYLPGDICRIMKEKGFSWFGMHQHTILWKQENAKDPAKGFGTTVAGTWYWYDSWLKLVEAHCKRNILGL